MHSLHQGSLSLGMFPYNDSDSGRKAVQNDMNRLWKAASLPKVNVAKVVGFSEIFVEPDKVQFCVKVETTKETVEDAKKSVSKRLDYITQIVRNSKVKVSMDLIVLF